MRTMPLSFKVDVYQKIITGKKYMNIGNHFGRTDKGVFIRKYSCQSGG